MVTSKQAVRAFRSLPHLRAIKTLIWFMYGRGDHAFVARQWRAIQKRAVSQVSVGGGHGC